MGLQERIKEITEIEFKQGVTAGNKKTEVYNPFGRIEPLTEFLKIKVSGEFRDKLRSLPNYAEIVRLILEHDLETGKFPLRKPTPRKRGRGGDLINKSGACEQLAVRVSKSFLEEIKQHKGWSAKAREALYEAIAELNIDLEMLPASEEWGGVLTTPDE